MTNLTEKIDEFTTQLNEVSRAIDYISQEFNFENLDSLSRLAVVITTFQKAVDTSFQKIFDEIYLEYQCVENKNQENKMQEES